ncbi:PTS sugar transporter subunit IIA, partial [Pyxidicoccus sp. 3LFB2]
MLTLSRTHVRLGQAATSKTEAIRLVGQTLVDEGFIEPGYVDSMLRREKVSATYLGNGIAIPHGTPDARAFVKKTGVVVVQFPRGVDWGGGPAHVVVGIAARSDEHLQVLANLTGVLGDAVKAEELARTTDAELVVATLNGAASAPEPEAAPLSVATRAPHRWSRASS